jgi:hypothetical protein
MGTPEPFREHEIDWERVRSHLDERGFAVIPGVLTEKTCDEIAAFYADDHRFRTRIEMSRMARSVGEQQALVS